MNRWGKKGSRKEGRQRERERENILKNN